MRTAIMLLMFITPSLAHALSEKEIIENVEKEFASMRTMSAKFKQTFHDVGMEDSEKSTGKVKMKKRLMMRWTYDPPDEQVIVSNGKNLYLYIPDENQVLVEKIGNVINTSSPALFLAGEYALKEIFTIRLATGENKDRISKDIRLELIPKKESISVTRILIGVDSKNWRIRSISIIDWADNRTDIEFFDIAINGDMNDDSFNFKTPKGVETVKLPNLKLE